MNPFPINNFNNMFNPNNMNMNLINMNRNFAFNNNMLNFNNNMNNFLMGQNFAFPKNNNMNENCKINNMNIIKKNKVNINSNDEEEINTKNFEQPSNLKSDVKLYNNDNYNRNLEMKFSLKNDVYILDIEEKVDYNSINFNCRLKEDSTLLYNYSCEKTFKELKNLNQAFKACNNIKQIFNVLQKYFIELYKKTKPRIDIINNKVIFYFMCDTYSGKFEDTTIILEKKKTYDEETYLTLEGKYVQLLEQFKEIQKIVWSESKNGKKVEQIKDICGKPNKYEC